MQNIYPLFDSHAHLTSDGLFLEIDAILKHAYAKGVSRILNICTEFECLERSYWIKAHYDGVYFAGAVHPHDVESKGELLFALFSKEIENGRFIAVGETGLDYHYNHSSREMQQNFLRKHIHLAFQYKLPLIIHCREAFSDLFRIFDEEKKEVPVVLHCFTGSLEEAKEVVRRGWMLSLSGIVTFKKSEELREVCKIVPDELLLIETDAPFLSPQAYRGKRNEPAYIVETATVVAQIRGVSAEVLANLVTQNALRFFQLEKVS